MKAEELDELFDAGEDISPYLDLTTKERPGHKQIISNLKNNRFPGNEFPGYYVPSLWDSVMSHRDIS